MGPSQMVTEKAPSSRAGSIAEKDLCRIVEIEVSGSLYRGETEAPRGALVGPYA